MEKLSKEQSERLDFLMNQAGQIRIKMESQSDNVVDAHNYSSLPSLMGTILINAKGKKTKITKSFYQGIEYHKVWVLIEIDNNGVLK